MQVGRLSVSPGLLGGVCVRRAGHAAPGWPLRQGGSRLLGIPVGTAVHWRWAAVGGRCSQALAAAEGGVGGGEAHRAGLSVVGTRAWHLDGLRGRMAARTSWARGLEVPGGAWPCDGGDEGVLLASGTIALVSTVASVGCGGRFVCGTRVGAVRSSAPRGLGGLWTPTVLGLGDDVAAGGCYGIQAPGGRGPGWQGRADAAGGTTFAGPARAAAPVRRGFVRAAVGIWRAPGGVGAGQATVWQWRWALGRALLAGCFGAFKVGWCDAAWPGSWLGHRALMAGALAGTLARFWPSSAGFTLQTTQNKV